MRKMVLYRTPVAVVSTPLLNDVIQLDEIEVTGAKQIK